MNYSRGITVVELVVLISVILIGIVGSFSFVSFSLVASDIHQDTNHALFLAQGEMEALRNYRDGVDWNNDDPADEYDGLGVVMTDTAYHLEESAAPERWKLLFGTETQEGYTIQVLFSNVQRDSNDNIVQSGGTVDPETKKAVVTVSWEERGRAHSVELPMYLTNWNK